MSGEFCDGSGKEVLRSSASTTAVPARLAVPTVSLAGVMVSSLSAEAVSSTSIGLSWQLLRPQRSVVDGFRVRYRPLKSRDGGLVDYLLKTVRPGDVTQFLLTGKLSCYLSSILHAFSSVVSYCPL